MTDDGKSTPSTMNPYAIEVIPDPASPDPSIPPEEMLARFRTARDTIRGRLQRFASEASPPA